MANEEKMMMNIMAVAVMATVVQSVLVGTTPAPVAPEPVTPGPFPEPPGPPGPIPEPTGEGVVMGIKNPPLGANYWSVCVHGVAYGEVGYDQKALCSLGVPINDYTLIFNDLPAGWMYPMCYRILIYQKAGDDYTPLYFVQSCNPALSGSYNGYKIAEYGTHVFDVIDRRLYNKRFYDV